MTWTDAQSYCRAQYTDLATVDDMEDLNRLITTLNYYIYRLWIGLKKGDSMKWQWSLADRRFYREGETEFRNWDTGTPQNGNCAFMSTAGLWNNTSCGDQHHFICYDGPAVETPEKPQLKRQVVRVKMTPKDPNLNLSDPAVQDDILQEIRNKLKEQGLPADTKLKWKKQPDGKVFNKEKEGLPKKEEEEEKKMKKRKKRMMTKREL
ncbi:hypothetical protein J4Q44_G00053970 [Coregonus suidteri]|uniref:C-type lectin domain-containing protein n=1 Tax=Coregonus suidteri TaxID=861788 RepID=A0AAN8R4B8_9TELE